MIKSADFRSFFGIPATLLFAATVVTAGSIAGTARAQNGAPAAQAALSAAQQFSEQDLQSYASAALQVQTISKSARDQIKGSNDAKATDDIQKKAEQDAVAAVKQQGLTVQKYNEIAVAMRTDPAVREKVLDYVQKLK